MSSTSAASGVRLPVWKKCLFALAAVALFVALAEVLLLALGVEPVLYDEDPYVGFSGTIPLFVEEVRADGSAWMVRAKNKEPYFNAQEFPREKSANAYRIFCLGGSTTYGHPYDDTTSFCGWLRELLRAAAPERDWQVINAGGISYASYRVALLAEELACYEPDLFVVYSGHNEFLERRTYPELIAMPRAVRGVAAALSRLRTYALLHRLLRGSRRSGVVRREGGEERELLPAEVAAVLDETVGPASYRRDDELRDRIVAHFRYNLARIVDIGRAAGAEVLLVRPASNLADCAPFKSERVATLSKGERARFTALLERARQASAAGRGEEALSTLDAALAIDGRHAQAHYERGRALARLGRHAEAKTAFLRARDEDVCPLRALSAIEEAVTEVAAERGAPSVDFRALVEARAEHGVPGDDLFLDHVHPTIEGNLLLAVAILDELRRLGAVEPAASWGPAAIEAVRERVEGRLDRGDHAVALKNLAKVLGWAGKYEEARRLAERSLEIDASDAEAQFHLGVTLERGGDLAGARSRYELTLRLSPRYREAHFRLGRLAEKEGRLDEAMAHYERALAIDASYAAAHASLGNVLAQRGDLRGAIEQLQAALRTEPRNAEVRGKLGVVFLRAGELERAAAELEEVLRLEPKDARAHNNLGTVRAESGDRAAAERHYRAALEIDPDYTVAHDNLANLLADAGELELAIAELATVLRLEPEHRAAREKLEAMARRFEEVLRARPQESEALFYRGLALEALGRREEAARSFGAFLRLRPEHAEARRRLEAMTARGEGAR